MRPAGTGDSQHASARASSPDRSWENAVGNGTARGTAGRAGSKPVVLGLLLACLALLGLLLPRPWLTGRSQDALLGPATVTASGAQAAPGLLACLLVVAAASLSAATAGRRVRVASATAGLAAAAVGLGLLVSTGQAPAQVLGRVAAELSGRTGSVPVATERTLWFWLAAALGGAVVVGALAVLVTCRRWPGLSSRFDGPAGGKTPTHPGSPWDDLSEGKDPTAVTAAGHDPTPPSVP